MQTEPVYDYPDPQPPQERRVCPQRGSLKSVSVLDRLLLTHPVWLQLSINAAAALHILQREPPGTFLVRKSSTSQKKVLCVRLTDDSVPSFVKQIVIREEDSTFSLESSAISFPDLCRLMAFYCVSRDVLPFTLELPEAICKATSHKQLESISHMGIEFWSSPLNFRGPRNGPPPVESEPSVQASQDGGVPQQSSSPLKELCPIRTRSPLELDCGTGHGALCFINPLFLQEQGLRGAPHRRHQFQRSLKIRVSTETSSPLSPPAAPPPPPPLLAKGTRHKAPGVAGDADTVPQEQSAPLGDEPDYLQPCVQKRASTAAGTFKRSPALSPTVEEEDYQTPRLPQKQGPVEPEGEVAELGLLLLGQRRVPSLSELDSSSSLSSLEEAEESPTRPPLERGTSSPAVPSPSTRPVSTLRKMSAVFMSFFTPGKRVARLVEDLARDRRTAFGALVQDFLRLQREELGAHGQASAAGLLQGLRLFLSQAKVFLLDCRELEPPIETLVPEQEKDLALEKAVFRCVLKPLKARLDATLRSLHVQDGSLQLMADSLRATQERTLERFGVRVVVPDAGGVEQVRQKLVLMQRAYSPIDKLVLLLQVCKAVYKAMRTDSEGQEFGADEFLPALSYVLVQCNMPELLMEVEYMMELLEPAWLMGEGGYYLTSVYASLCLIQSQPETVLPGGLTRKAEESLREWSHRRSTEGQNHKHKRFVRVLFQDGEISSMKTLQWNEGDSVEALACLCAAKFGVAEPDQYALYWRTGEEVQALQPHTQIQELQNQARSVPSLVYQPRDEDGGKTRKLTRGGAVDFGESN